MRHVRAFIVLGMALLLGGVAAAGSTASARDTAAKESAAEASAKSWLKLVDDGRYAESWTAAADLFRTAVPMDRWVSQVGAARAPFGKALKRRVDSTKYATTLPGAPDGEYVVITYATSFARKQSAVETVTVTFGADKAWRVCGYFVR